MGTQWLLVGIPLLVFAIIDSLGNKKLALGSAIALSLVEFGVSYYFIQQIDWTSVVSVGLIIFLAGISLVQNNTLAFKMQPSIVALVVGVFFLITFLSESYFLADMLRKYKSVLYEQRLYQQAHFLEDALRTHYFHWVELYLGLSFLVQSLVMYWVAKRCHNGVWIVGRIVGTVGCCVVAMFFARYHL